MGTVDGFDAVLSAAQQGEDWAVAKPVRDVRPKLARFLELREPRAAEDIESEVWLAVAQGLARFSGGEEQFRAWVFSIARRRLADFRRTAIRRRRRPFRSRSWTAGGCRARGDRARGSVGGGSHRIRDQDVAG
jgi:RNA polymerase sigma-70 factor (ECF subfamily)